MRRSARRRIKRRRRILAVSVVALLAGCSSIPDAINPVEWFKGARDLVLDSDGQTRAAETAQNDPRAGRGQAAPGAGQPIPDLNTVPERPKPSSREQRAKTQRGLVSDREGARRYSNDAVRRQGDPVNPLQASPRTSPQKSPGAAAPRIETPPRTATPSPRPPAAAAPAPRPAPPPRQAAPTPPTPPTAASAPQPAPKAAPAPRPTPQRRQAAPAVDGGGPETPGTIVISSAGVQTARGASIGPPALSPGAARPALPPGADAASKVGGFQRLSEFSPAAGRGSYQVATIQFDNGSSRLNARDRRIIRQVFAQQRQTGGTIRIVGHASRRTANMDLIRHKEVNLRVSAARADAVARELIRIGARPGSLFVGAVSSQYPRYHEYMPSGEAGNRRAEIFIDF